MNIKEKTITEPFIRWAGGKQKIIRKLIQYLPDDVEKRFYKEPFLGAGSLFFAIKPQRAILSDANEHLINCYNYVKSHYNLISHYLDQHRKRTCQEYYYYIRKLYNDSHPSPAC